jgi:hypothetical protein
MNDPAHLLTEQFLQWIAARPRRYAEVMEAWRTSCPRLPVWETAVDSGLVCLERKPGAAMADCLVVLTAAGREALEASEPSFRAAAAKPVDILPDCVTCCSNAA